MSIFINSVGVINSLILAYTVFKLHKLCDYLNHTTSADTDSVSRILLDLVVVERCVVPSDRICIWNNLYYLIYCFKFVLMTELVEETLCKDWKFLLYCYLNECTRPNHYLISPRLLMWSCTNRQSQTYLQKCLDTPLGFCCVSLPSFIPVTQSCRTGKENWSVIWLKNKHFDVN